MATTLSDRAAGAVVGALVGDALGLGPHWYYDLEAMRRDYGDWIDTYTDPLPGRYHAGLKAGDLSQTGLITLELLASVAANDGYDQDDFTRRMDENILAHTDGTAYSGPGGYTSISIRELHQARVKEGLSWSETGGYADTTEAAERAVVLAARYARNPGLAAELTGKNVRLTQIDPFVVAQSMAFNVIVSAIVRGEAFDKALGKKIWDMLGSGELPFTRTVLAEERGPMEKKFRPPSATLAYPDSLIQPFHIWKAARDPGVRVEPAWKASLVYGMPCAINCQLPAAYYLAARFPEDFESAVLHALNGGGNNMSRAMLTGALVGAGVGLSGIPERFVEGLSRGAEIVDLARQLGEEAEREAGT